MKPEKFKFMLIIGVSYTLFGFLYAFLKFYVNLPRPYCSLSANEFRTILDTSTSRCLSSFPSSHAGIGFMIAYFFWNHTNRIMVKIFLISIMFLVVLSRISLAMHYPMDIFYGIVFSYFVIKISQKICENKSLKNFSQYVLNIIYSTILK